MTHEPELVERYGDWIAEVRRVEVKAFGGRTLWFWTFGHAVIGDFASGRGLTREEAVSDVLAELDQWKTIRG